MNTSPSLTRPLSRNQRAQLSRQLLLEATLRLIREHGLHAISHRQIATEAGLSLSLTTHFFSSLNDLLGQAFDLYVTQALPINLASIQAAGELLNQQDRRQRRSLDGRRRLHQQLSAHLCRFILKESQQRAQGIAVELNFLYLHRLEPTLRAKALDYREQLLQPLAKLLRELPSANPQTDAALLLGTIHRLEFDCINTQEDSAAAMRATVQEEVGRMLGLLLKL